MAARRPLRTRPGRGRGLPGERFESVTGTLPLNTRRMGKTLPVAHEQLS